jgi:hypothetical protein
MEDYFSIRPLRPHWRNFFEDGTVVDLYPEKDLMAREAAKVGEIPGRIEAFLDYSGRLYDLVDRGYFQQGLDTSREFRDFYGLMNFLQFDLFHTMHGSVARHLTSRYLRDVFDFFIKTPEVGLLNPIVQIIPIQILAYQLAVLRGYSPERLALEFTRSPLLAEPGVVFPGAAAGAAATAQQGVVGAVAQPLFAQWLVPFELTSVLLLAAMVGAVVLAKRKV